MSEEIVKASTETAEHVDELTQEQATEQATEQTIEQTIEQPKEEAIANEIENESKSDETNHERPAEEEEEQNMDDLFGEEEEEEQGSRNEEDEDEDEDEEGTYRRQRAGSHNHLGLDDEEAEEQAMYTRKFYGEDADDLSEEEKSQHHFKEETVELVRHIVPYRAVEETEIENPTIYYAKVPEFLTIDPIPFDPPNFETKVKERLANSSKEDQLGDSLIDENTIRWRYSRDENQRVYKESNAQIVEWSDGKFSLKLGDEYTDILVNDIDNTFFAVSHDQQELMQCSEGGEITKSLMFIPTSTNSKMHQKLTKAVMRRNQRQVSGPGIYIVNKDPELEKSELEKQQQQRVRERRKRHMKEIENRESPDVSGAFDRVSGYKKPRTSSMEPDSYSTSLRRNEYEQDDFLVDDDEEEEVEYADEDEEDDLLDADEQDEEDEKAERLKELKRSGASKYENKELSSSTQATSRRRRVALIDDDEDDE